MNLIQFRRELKRLWFSVLDKRNFRGDHRINVCSSHIRSGEHQILTQKATSNQLAPSFALTALDLHWSPCYRPPAVTRLNVAKTELNFSRHRLATSIHLLTTSWTEKQRTTRQFFCEQTEHMIRPLEFINIKMPLLSNALYDPVTHR